MDVSDVIEFLGELSEDMSMPRNVRTALDEIKCSLGDCTGEEIPLRVDAALQRLEGLASDPNLTSFGRTELWHLTSAVEGLNK